MPAMSEYDIAEANQPDNSSTMGRYQVSPLTVTTMTSLPSFVDLMASLGLEQKKHTPSKSSTSPYRTPPLSPFVPRSHSVPFRNLATQRQRYSPYSSAILPMRRGSSTTPTPEPEQTISKHRSLPSIDVSNRYPAHHSINLIDSTSDADANAPISRYVRRKRSSSSLTSSTLPRKTKGNGNDVRLPCIPTLPSLLPSNSNAANLRMDNTPWKRDARSLSQSSPRMTGQNRSHQRKNQYLHSP